MRPTGQSASASAVIAGSRCQVIPSNGEPPCWRAWKPPQSGAGDTPWAAEAGDKLIFCKEHNAERLNLYFGYKQASTDVDRLEDAARDTSFRKPGCLDRETVDAAITTCDAFAAALHSELEGREAHRRRFIGKGDAKHAARVSKLRREQTANSKVLVRLRQRRDALDRADAFRAQAENEAARIRRVREEAARKRQGEAAAAMQQKEARRQQRVRAAWEEAGRETQPLLHGAGRVRWPQPSTSTMYPQLPPRVESHPYLPRAAPQTVYTPNVGSDVERQDAAMHREESENGVLPTVFTIWFLVVLALCALFVFVKFVG